MNFAMQLLKINFQSLLSSKNFTLDAYHVEITKLIFMFFIVC
jgi:hypothetical protein